MIKEWLTYEAVCDTCDEVHDAPDNFDEEEALSRAESSGWIRMGDNIFCSKECSQRLVAA